MPIEQAAQLLWQAPLAIFLLALVAGLALVRKAVK